MSEGHRVAVYYQTQYDSSMPANSAFGHYVSPLPLLTFITQYVAWSSLSPSQPLYSHPPRSIFLAAFHIDTDKSVHLNDNPPEAPMFTQMWTELGEMQASGVKVIGMLGA